MAPTLNKPVSTFDFRGQEYVTEVLHRGNLTVKQHYPVERS